MTTESLDPIRERLSRGERLTEDEGLALYMLPALLELGRIVRLVESEASAQSRNLITVRRIRYTNVCRNQCRHCHRAKAPGEEGAFTRSLAQIADLVGEAVDRGVEQVQLVGGANPDEPYEYYIEMVSSVSQAFPQVQLAAFAPAQLAHIAQVGGVGSQELLEDLLSAGAGSIPEDGADIFDPTIRRHLCPSKASGGTWLQVMREAHELGMVTGGSMLYGHFEGPAEKVEHLSRLRDLQDETHGFGFYAPRAFRPNGSTNGNYLVGGVDDLREFAVGRIFLSNFPHIRCYAHYLGMKTTQIALHFGVDTVVVAIRDDEPFDDEERSARGLPNATQLKGLIANSGFELQAADPTPEPEVATGAAGTE